MNPEQPWTTQHSRLVSAAAPEIEPLDAVGLDAGWDAIATRIQPGRSSGSRRVAVLAVSAALVMGIGGTAAAAGLLARTGVGPSDSEDLVLGGPGERLNPVGEDFAQVVIEETRDIPFPTDAARAVSNNAQAHDYDIDIRDGVPISVSVGALRGFTADDAVCSWANTWAAAVTAGDSAAKAAATAMLQQATSWPAVTALDTEFTVGTKTITIAPGGSIDSFLDRRIRELLARGEAEVDDSSRFGYLRLVQQAASGTDLDAMGKALIDHVVCRADLVPDLPQSRPELPR